MIPLLIPAALGLIGGYLSREPKKYHLGGDMSKHLAPNGKPSKLTHKQYKLVRTPKFKGWFGDWENDPENASKVVDENGEPMVCYHGGSYSSGKFIGTGWFTVSKSDAKYYAKQNNGIVIQVFLKIKEPLYTGNIKYLNIKPNKDILDSAKKRNIKIDIEKDKIQFMEANGGVLIARDIGRDGILDLHEKKIIDAVVFNSNQIKLADGSNTTFEANNPNIRYEDGGFIGTWSELQKVNPNLWETGIFRRTLNPMGATDIIPKDVHIRQGQWQNYGQYDEIEAETIYGEPDNYGYYNDEDGNPISDERTGNYIKDEWDYENDTEIKAIISNKQLRNNLIDSFKTQQGKEYLKKVIASLPKNADGTITAYRIGTIGGGAQSYTLSERMAKTFSNQGTDIMPSGLPSIPKEGYKDYGVLPVNKVRINPKGIVAWSPYDSEILVEPKYVILEISN
jgi:hypothetical protein